MDGMNTYLEIMRNAALVGLFLTALAGVMLFLARVMVGTSGDRTH